MRNEPVDLRDGIASHVHHRPERSSRTRWLAFYHLQLSAMPTAMSEFFRFSGSIPPAMKPLLVACSPMARLVNSIPSLIGYRAVRRKAVLRPARRLPVPLRFCPFCSVDSPLAEAVGLREGSPLNPFGQFRQPDIPEGGDVQDPSCFTQPPASPSLTTPTLSRVSFTTNAISCWMAPTISAISSLQPKPLRELCHLLSPRRDAGFLAPAWAARIWALRSSKDSSLQSHPR